MPVITIKWALDVKVFVGEFFTEIITGNPCCNDVVTSAGDEICLHCNP